MDILYIFHGNKGYSEELHYSLRSIAKNCTNRGRIFIVGEKPEWCNEKVIHITYKRNEAIGKENDITAAIFHAVSNSDISDRFLISADDYFYIRKTDLNKYPIYTKGLLPEIVKPALINSLYQRSLVNTRILLLAAGYEPVNYGHHALFYGDRKLMQKHKSLFEAGKMFDCGATFDSLMAAIIAKKDKKITILQRKDHKLTGCKDYEDLLEQIGDTEVFSITDNAMRNGVRKVLQSLFPYKCEYEK